jgi:hypothetical protein
MKSPSWLIFVLLMALTACGGGARDAATNSAPKSEAKAVSEKADGDAGFNQAADTFAVTDQAVSLPKENLKQVSLTQADTLASTAEPAGRKIIRNANLTMEVDSTTEAQHRVTSIAESHGGFVVASESKQRENADPGKRALDIKLVVRIPATRFGVALDEIRGLANNLREENVTGQDVTEEFIDLEARIKTQRALELQFLEIMKQAHKVEDALEVQRQIADVRTDIEKLEGRKRFLENRASLSTITVNLEAPRQITVSTTGFSRDLRETVSDSIDLGAGIILFLVRFVIVMVPITLFLLLPLGLVLRYLVRRAKRIRLAEALSTPAAD